ncbi:hypothetical protein [Corallococcus macrosporus]|uniref:HD domain-containing protein n=1 Tax=Myxococcus fulvus (strain ATCC BAA-855 / HW-1) TaxID=483219 RepID=F8CNG5_MYXFH|nr:hypothetical protein [Corallococcus macrosporus]AEI62882.1 hypothetical protein LILAB_04805 [Corallococcus macrosporus]
MLRQLLLSDFRAEGPAAGHGWPLVQQAFPTVQLAPLSAGRGAHVLRLDVSEWNAPAFDPVAWDARVFDAGERTEWLALHLEGASREALVVAALEILTRYQCLVGRRNAASATPLFSRLLARHRSLHDLKQPQVRAEFHRAVDAWQWTLRLRPEVDLPLQAAALFHDVEQPAHGPLPLRAFDRVQPARGADRAVRLLEEAGADDASCRRVRELVTRGERPGGERDVSLLRTAGALSFFSRQSSSYFREAPPEHHRRQVARMLAHLRPEHLRWLGHMRLAPAVRGQLEVLVAAHFPVDVLA